MDLDIARMFQSYAELSTFNKIALWGSIASIIGLLIALIAMRSATDETAQETFEVTASERASSPDVSNTAGDVTINYGDQSTHSSPAVENCPYSDIDKRISETPKGDPAALTPLAQYILKSVSGTSDACRSSALRAFVKFNDDSVDAYNDLHQHEIAMIPYEASALAAYNQRIAVAGWELGTIEGSFFVQTDDNWIQTTFDAIMPVDWREYFLQLSKELREEFTHDAFILIPFDEVRKRIIYWEEFLKRHPLFPLRDEPEYRIVRYLAVYLSGTDNSRIYEEAASGADWDSPRPLRQEVRNSYQNFIAVNQESKHFQLVFDWFSTIQANDFMVTDELIGSFLEQHRARGGLGIEFPRR